MNVLIVGAGAVGQVYARHLLLGGHGVSLMVKEKYAESCRAGLPMYPLHGHQKGQQVTLSVDEVLTTSAEVAERPFDQVWLCISTPALKGRWLHDLVAAMGDAVLVSMTPGLTDANQLGELVPADRRVQGMIGFIPWQSPLATETRDPPGIAVYLPPGSPSLFGGAEAPARAAVAALRSGRCPARYKGDVARASAFGSAFLLAAIAGLEAAKWSFAGFRRDRETLALTTGAARESLAVAASWHDTATPWLGGLIRPWSLRIALALAPRVVPFDLETYMAYHFTKVGDQTRQHLDTVRELGVERGLAVGEVARLRAALS